MNEESATGIELIQPRRRGREPLVQPFMKWAGGKRQLLPFLRPLVPSKFKRYFEPFIGGGALFFDLQARVAVINDFNAELVNCYRVIRDSPEELLIEASKHQNTSEHYYRVREMDRNPKFELLSPAERAARLIYLNKTCYNGLFRVNSQGQFNVPFGCYKNPLIADPAVIRAISAYLNRAEVTIRSQDFGEAVLDAEKGDFVYFDPPYDPVSDTASFTGYSLNGFGRDQQCRLREVCDLLTNRGVKVLVSNSDTSFIRGLYSGSQYNIQDIQARRAINSDPTGRGKTDEVLVLNYEV